MLLICPTAQGKRPRQIGTTGKSLAERKILSSEERLDLSAWGGSKMTSGFVDIEGDLPAHGRADRVEQKTLRNQRVYA